jgi:lipopolysaccharide heptosyltransferase II
MMSIDPQHILRILVREVNWVGDAVLTLPALEALRGRFPMAEITLLARSWVGGLFAGHPAVDRIIEYRSEDAHRGLRGRWRLAGELREGRFDLAVLFPNSMDAALIPWLAGVPRRIGYPTDGRHWLLTHPVSNGPAAESGHQVERYLAIVRALGGDGTPTPRLPVTESARQKSGELLRQHGIPAGDLLVALNPGSIYGSAKRWPADRFAALADGLVESHGAKILLVGSRGERPVLDRVAAHMRRPAVNLVGRTDLPTLVGLLERVHLLVSNDTGAMHVAVAVGTPVLAIFGPTDTVATGPLGKCVRVVRLPVPCSPCLLRECPIDHRCMTGVTVAQILGEARTLLGVADLHPRPHISGGAPAAFLDRDGTIIEDPGYLRDPEKLQFIPGAVGALGELQRAGYRLVLVSNQAGVARGLLTETDVQQVNERLTRLLAAAGVHLDGVYYCPHHPDYGPPNYRRDCDCRKPKPGMVHRAIRDLGLNPGRSVVIGDHVTDAALASAFPGMVGIMLRTGHGAEQWQKIREGSLAMPEHVAEDLAAAVRWFLTRTGERDVIASTPA